MLNLIEDNKCCNLEWIYAYGTPEFLECKHWVVLDCEGQPIIYGLGFDPYDLADEVENETEDNLWVWPTNQQFINVIGVLQTWHQVDSTWTILTTER